MIEQKLQINAVYFKAFHTFNVIKHEPFRDQLSIKTMIVTVQIKIVELKSEISILEH